MSHTQVDEKFLGEALSLSLAAVLYTVEIVSFSALIRTFQKCSAKSVSLYQKRNMLAILNATGKS